MTLIPIEKGLVTILTGDSGVAAIVSARVYPIRLPQGVTIPAITYQRISTPHVGSHDMTKTGLAHPRFQITCWDDDYSGVNALKLAVISALQGYHGSPASGGVGNVVRIDGILQDGDRDNFDPETGLYFQQLDFIIWHEE